MVGTIGLHAQATGPRFLPPAFWSSERYAGGQSEIPPGGQIILWRTDGQFNQSPRWSINPVSAMRDIIEDDISEEITHVRPANAPNYSLNYEFVRYSGVGYFHDATDVTNSALQQQHTTRVPAVFLVQAGHVSYGRPDNNSMPVDMNPCLQVFTIESRSHVVAEPNRTPDAAFFRQTNLEGLGEARTVVGNDEIANPAKIDILVERSDVSHPTLLRFSDPTIDPANIHGYAHGDFDNDGRDDLALFVRVGTTSELIILSNDEAPDNTPLDYVLTRHNVLNYSTTACDHLQLRHVVAADVNGDGRDEIYALFDAGCNGTVPSVERFEQTGTTWTRTTLTIVDRDGLTFFDDILSMTAVRNNLAGEESIVFLAGDAAAVHAWTPPNTKNHTGIWIGELTIDGNDVTFEANVTSITDVNLASNFSVGSLVTTDLNGDGIDEVGFFTERRAQNVVSSVDFVSLRRIVSGFEQSVLLRLDATVIPRDNIYHTISGNIDYDVRNRTDVAILFQDLDIGRHEDRLLVWRSMAPYTENDYAITRLENGVQTPFFPHGWWGIRLTSGQLGGDGQPLSDVNFVDQWRLIETWPLQDEIDRIVGIHYSPTVGRIPDAEIENYAEIYNTVVLDRYHHSDGYIFNRLQDQTADDASTQYYYNVNECVQGLAASAAIAAQHNLSVIPVVSHLAHDNYNIDGTQPNVRRFIPFDFQQASLGAGMGNPLPNYFQTIFPVIAQTNAILGTYIADEPTNEIPLVTPSTWGDVFNPQLQPALTPAALQQNSRDFALTTMHRAPGKPVMLNFNFQHDFEFYRNAYDVSLFDFYMYKYDYATTNLVENGQVVADVVRTRVQQNTDNTTNAIIQHSFNPILRKQVDATIRCDKQAAMVIAQGRGDEYMSRDVRMVNDVRTTLRTYSGMRNITVDEARYQMFVPAILGIRGSIFWEATSWIQGASDDPLYESHEQNMNVWGEVIHHMARNTERTIALRAAIDNASEEFAHYRNIFLQPSLNDHLTVSTLIPNAELNWTPVVAAVHRDPVDNTLWLFVGNMSTNNYDAENPVTVTTGHSGEQDVVEMIPSEFWNGGNPVVWASTYAHGLRRITMHLAPYQVRAFRIGPDLAPSEVDVEVLGHLDYSNQRKLVIFESAEINVNGGHANDPENGVVRYHAVYHRSACEECPPEFNGSQVFYRRSVPMRKSDPSRLILWEDIEHCLSCEIIDPVQGASAAGTCAYPSIVVKYEEDPGPPPPGGTTSRARVHVVYACDVNAWGPMEHPGTDHMGRILIVENIIDANATQQLILPGQVYDRADGESIHTHGFPVIGAVDGGYLYAHSDRDFGIVGAYKPDQQLQYVNPLSVTAVSMFNYSDNHPAIWQYASQHKPNDLPVVWNAKLPDNNQNDNLVIFYAQLAHVGGNVAVFRELAPPQLPDVFADGHAIRVSPNVCGSHLLPSVLRMTTSSADFETDIIYWQNYRPVGCHEIDHQPENLYQVFGKTMLSGLIVAPNIGPNLRLDGLHQIRHTQASVYDPNVTNGFRMIDDPDPFGRSMISVSVNPTRFPLFDRSQIRRESELYWLREEPHRLYSSNVYIEHQVTNRTRTVTRHDDLGSVLQQSAKHGSFVYEDFLVNRGIYQTTPAITPEIVTSRRAYFAPRSETPLTEYRTLFEFADGTGASNIQSLSQDGQSIRLHFASDGSVTSEAMSVNGVSHISIRGKFSGADLPDVSLVNTAGMRMSIRCTDGEFLSVVKITGADSLRLLVTPNKSSLTYHVTEIGRRSPMSEHFRPTSLQASENMNSLRRVNVLQKSSTLSTTDSLPSSELVISPNPASTKIRIVLHGYLITDPDCQDRTLHIVETATGRTATLPTTWLDASTLELDLQGLASGSYVITVTCGENVTHGTFTVTF